MGGTGYMALNNNLNFSLLNSVKNLYNILKKNANRIIPTITASTIALSVGNSYAISNLVASRTVTNNKECVQTSTQTLQVPTFYIKNPSINIYRGGLDQDNLTQIITLHYEGTKESGHYNENERHGFDIVPGVFINVENDPLEHKLSIEESQYRGTSVVIPANAYAQFSIPQKEGEEVRIIGISENKELNDLLGKALEATKSEPRFVLNPEELTKLGSLLGINSGNARGTLPVQIQLYCDGCDYPAAGNMIIDIEQYGPVIEVKYMLPEKSERLRAAGNETRNKSSVLPVVEQKEGLNEKEFLRIAGVKVSTDNVDNLDKATGFLEIPYMNAIFIADTFHGDGPVRDRGFETFLILNKNPLLFYAGGSNHSVAADLSDVKEEFGNEVNLVGGVSIVGRPIIGISALANHEWSDIDAATSTSDKMLYSARIGYSFAGKYPFVLQYLGNGDEKDHAKNLGVFFGKIDAKSLDQLLVLNQASSEITMEHLGLNNQDYLLFGVAHRHNDRDIESEGMDGNGNYDSVSSIIAFGKNSYDLFGKVNYCNDKQVFSPLRYYSELTGQWIEILPGTEYNNKGWDATIGLMKEIHKQISIFADTNFDKEGFNRTAIGAAFRF